MPTPGSSAIQGDLPPPRTLPLSAQWSRPILQFTQIIVHSASCYGSDNNMFLLNLQIGYHIFEGANLEICPEAEFNADKQ